MSDDSQKNAILLAHLKRGMVVIHDGLPYSEPPSSPAPMSHPYSNPFQEPRESPDYHPMWFLPYLGLVASRNFAV